MSNAMAAFDAASTVIDGLIGIGMLLFCSRGAVLPAARRLNFS
ncbi:hypothetical protein ACGK9R_01395 [Halomonas sp. HNIBRBA4712]